MTEIKKATDLINRMNFNYNYPSEAGCREVMNGLVNIAAQSDITLKDAEAIRDNIPLNLNYINESYTNAIMPEVVEKVDAMIREKDLEKTNRMNPIKSMN